MISEHAITLLVVLPLMVAPVCLLLPSGRLPWLLATLAVWASFLMGIMLAIQVGEHGVVSYQEGGWPPPWGIEYRADALNALVVLLVTGIGSIIMPFAARSAEHEIQSGKLPGFYAALLLTFSGLLGMTLTADVFNLFVFLEISSLSTYILISLSEKPRALLASFQYLVLGTIGATFILIGIGLTYAMTGTLNMADLANRLPELHESRTIHTAFAFIFLGVGIKLALFPLHVWLPNAYTYAPSVVGAFLAATATKVAFYVLIRFVHTVFGVEFTFDQMPFQLVSIALALAAILLASYAAMIQADARRLLAYSSVAQIGYMVLGVGMASSLGLMAGVLHMFNHAVMKGALFLALGCVMYRIGSMRIQDMRGIGHEMPWTMAAFVIGGLSLIGVPPTAGFISKWYLVVAALDKGWLPVVAVIIVSSLFAVVYIWRVVEAAWLAPADESRSPVREAPLSMLVPVWVLVLANLWLGVDTRLTVQLSSSAVQTLMGVAP